MKYLEKYPEAVGFAIPLVMFTFIVGAVAIKTRFYPAPPNRFIEITLDDSLHTLQGYTVKQAYKEGNKSYFTFYNSETKDTRYIYIKSYKGHHFHEEVPNPAFESSCSTAIVTTQVEVGK